VAAVPRASFGVVLEGVRRRFGQHVTVSKYGENKEENALKIIKLT
jgi:hypothetical protein